MFVTLPKVFNSMPGGNIIGIVFFVLVLFAALTSFAAPPPDPSAWYTPSPEDYVAPIDWPCIAYLSDARGNQQEVNFVAGDSRSNLFIAALRTT